MATDFEISTISLDKEEHRKAFFTDENATEEEFEEYWQDFLRMREKAVN